MVSNGCRVHSLRFDTSKQISSIHKKGITWLDLEQAENRYLLAGSADCSVAIYDVAQPLSGDVQHSNGPGDYGSVLKITSATPGCHQYSVSSVAWYPIDTGLFVTGSFDNQVKACSCQPFPAQCLTLGGSRKNSLSMTFAGLGCKSWPSCLQLHLPRPGIWRGNVSSCCHTLPHRSGWWRPSCKTL